MMNMIPILGFDSTFVDLDLSLIIIKAYSLSSNVSLID